MAPSRLDKPADAGTPPPVDGCDKACRFKVREYKVPKRQEKHVPKRCGAVEIRDAAEVKKRASKMRGNVNSPNAYGR